MKKLITGFTALSIISAAIVPLSASAIYIPADSYEEIQKQLEGYTYITDFEVQENDPNYPSDYDLYIQIPEKPETVCGVKLLMKENYDTVDITVSNGNGRKVLSEAMEKAKINGKVFTDDNITCECRLYDNTSAEKVKKLYAELNEKDLITDFVYSNQLYSVREGGTTNELLGKFGFCSYDYDSGIWTSPEEQLANYEKLSALAEKLLPGSTVKLESYEDKEIGCTVYSASVVPAVAITIEERIDFALKAKEEIGIFGGYFINEDEIPAIKTENVDLVKAVEGDANCDGNVDMSDAVLIMQSIANPSKYKLTAQGSFNADTDGDGITSGDALAIQKKLLKLD